MILTRLIGRRLNAGKADVGPAEMPGFDRAFYLAANPDVAAKRTDPLKHYLEHGWREGREPSAGFSGQRYLAHNPDVQAAGINPLAHYLNHGLAEGRPGASAETAPPAETQPAPSPSPAEPQRQPTRLL